MRSDRRRKFQYTGLIMDIMNLVLGLTTIILAIVVLVNVKENVKLFPVLFATSGTMNFIMGLKYFKRDEKSRGIMLVIAAIIILAVSAIGFIALWR